MASLGVRTYGPRERICDRFDEQKIEAFFRKWLRRLPHPFSAQERRAGYRYDLSILQAEFSLTQQLQQPADIEGQRVSALRFGDPRVHALFAVLLIFSLQPQGFRNRELRPLIAQALGLDNEQITQGKMKKLDSSTSTSSFQGI